MKVDPAEKLDLKPEDAEKLLIWLFSSTARRPERLDLRATAGVARYLMALASERGEPAQRTLVEAFARVLWGTLLQSGRIQIATKAEVVQFLQHHAATYLAGLPTDQAIEAVKNLDPPVQEQSWFRPPQLMARHRSVSGPNVPRLDDDLTERIWAGYRLLRRAKIRGARTKVAKLLNQLGFQTEARGQTSQQWGPYEVIERVNQFEDFLKKGAKRGNEKNWLRLTRVARTNSWLEIFLLDTK